MVDTTFLQDIISQTLRKIEQIVQLVLGEHFHGQNVLVVEAVRRMVGNRATHLVRLVLGQHGVRHWRDWPQEILIGQLEQFWNC